MNDQKTPVWYSAKMGPEGPEITAFTVEGFTDTAVLIGGRLIPRVSELLDWACYPTWAEAYQHLARTYERIERQGVRAVVHARDGLGKLGKMTDPTIAAAPTPEAAA